MAAECIPLYGICNSPIGILLSSPLKETYLKKCLMTASRQQSLWDLLQHWGVAMFFLGSCLPVTEYSGILTSLHFFPTWVLFKAVLWGSGSSSGEGNGNPLQYSCLENAMDRGAWQATVHGITRIWHNLLLWLFVIKKSKIIWSPENNNKEKNTSGDKRNSDFSYLKEEEKKSGLVD